MPYAGPPSPVCAPAEAQKSAQQVAQRASEEVNARLWETFAQASAAEVVKETTAKEDPQPDLSTKAKDKAADSIYRIAAAANALVTDA